MRHANGSCNRQRYDKWLRQLQPGFNRNADGNASSRIYVLALARRCRGSVQSGDGGKGCARRILHARSKLSNTTVRNEPFNVPSSIRFHPIISWFGTNHFHTLISRSASVISRYGLFSPLPLTIFHIRDITVRNVPFLCALCLSAPLREITARNHGGRDHPRFATLTLNLPPRNITLRNAPFATSQLFRSATQYHGSNLMDGLMERPAECAGLDTIHIIYPYTFQQTKRRPS